MGFGLVFGVQNGPLQKPAITHDFKGQFSPNLAGSTQLVKLRRSRTFKSALHPTIKKSPLFCAVRAHFLHFFVGWTRLLLASFWRCFGLWEHSCKAKGSARWCTEGAQIQSDSESDKTQEKKPKQKIFMMRFSDF